MAQLSLNQVSLTIKNKKILSSLSFYIKSGTITGLLGPNGSGKTSCFYAIIGLIIPTSGCITLNETNITYYSISKRSQYGLCYLPQESSIFNGLTVEDNIMAAIELQSSITKKQRTNQLDRLIKQFNLKTIRKTLGIQLSGGERRRTEIARTLVCNPKFILLDEPFAGIDPISIIEIKNIILQLKQHDIGILITDHNVRETLNLCDNAFIINNGKIIMQGNKESILTSKSVQKHYLGEEFSL